MAVTPIQLFTPQGGGVISALSQGQANFANSLNNILQVGRGIADRQTSQERDFLGERRRLEDLEFRKGRGAAQDARADREFARGIFEDDRDFLATEAERKRADERFDRQEGRLDRQFDTGLEEAKINREIRREELAGRKDERDFKREDLEFKRKDLERARELREGAITSARDLLTPETVTPLVENRGQELTPLQSGLSELFQQSPAFVPGEPVEAELGVDTEGMSPEEMIRVGELLARAASALGDLQAEQDAQRLIGRGETALEIRKLEAQERKTSQRSTSPTSRSTKQDGSLTFLQTLGVLEDAEATVGKEWDARVTSDDRTFPSASSFVAKDATLTPEQEEVLVAQDSDRTAAEFTSATQPGRTETQYADMVDSWASSRNMTSGEVTAAKKRRREFYKWANQETVKQRLAKQLVGDDSATPDTTTPEKPSGESAEDLLKRLNQD